MQTDPKDVPGLPELLYLVNNVVVPLPFGQTQRLFQTIEMALRANARPGENLPASVGTDVSAEPAKDAETAND